MSILFIGDCGVDLYNQHTFEAGGCALNVATHAQQLGQTIDILSWVGTDPAGESVRQFLEQREISTDHIATLPGKTATQEIMITPSGEKHFEAYQPGVLTTAKISPADHSWIQQHAVVMTIYYQQFAPIFEQVISLPYAGYKVIDFMNGADFNYDVSFVAGLSEWFDLTFFGLDATQTHLISALTRLAQEKNKMCVITLGAAGGLIVHGNTTHTFPSLATKIVDTTGCGDAFAAGFLTTYLNTNDVLHSIKVASHQAAITAQHQGGHAL